MMLCDLAFNSFMYFFEGAYRENLSSTESTAAVISTFVLHKLHNDLIAIPDLFGLVVRPVGVASMLEAVDLWTAFLTWTHWIRLFF